MCETIEIAYVAICERSNYKMPGALDYRPSWRSLVRDATCPATHILCKGEIVNSIEYSCGQFIIQCTLDVRRCSIP